MLDFNLWEKTLDPVKSWAQEGSEVKITMLEALKGSKHKVGESIKGYLELLETSQGMVLRVSSSFTNYIQTKEVVSVIDIQEFRVVIKCLDGVYCLEKV